MPTDVAKFPRMNVSVRPTVEPVSPTEALEFCQYYGGDVAAQVQMEGFLLAARREVERRGAWALITQTRVVKYDRFCGGVLELPIHPVQSITALQYSDANGSTQTLSASLYQLDKEHAPARVAPVDGAVWPFTKGGTFNTVTLTFVAGFGDEPEDVPEELKLAIKFLARSYSPWGMCKDADVADSLIGQSSWRPTWL